LLAVFKFLSNHFPAEAMLPAVRAGQPRRATTRLAVPGPEHAVARTLRRGESPRALRRP